MNQTNSDNFRVKLEKFHEIDISKLDPVSISRQIYRFSDDIGIMCSNNTFSIFIFSLSNKFETKKF